MTTISKFPIFLKNLENWPTFKKFSEIFEISKYSSSLSSSPVYTVIVLCHTYDIDTTQCNVRESVLTLYYINCVCVLEINCSLFVTQDTLVNIVIPRGVN